MTLVIDVSVAVKWFFEEEGHAAARAVMDRDAALLAPSSVLAEIGSAAWKRARRGEIAQKEANDVLNLMARPFSQLVPFEHLIPEAGRLMLRHDHPIYDCFYLALALKEDAPSLPPTGNSQSWRRRLGLQRSYSADALPVCL